MAHQLTELIACTAGVGAASGVITMVSRHNGARTAVQMLGGDFLVPISILPWALGFAGAIYGATAGMSGATIILLAIQLHRSDGTQKRPAPRLFAFRFFTCSCSSPRY